MVQTPVQIVFDDVSHSRGLEILIRKKAGRLETVFPRLMRCHVCIGVAHHHSGNDRRFQVRIILHVPGGQLTVDRDQHQDVHAAVRDAFDAACSLLEAHARKVRSESRRGAGIGTMPGSRHGQGQ